MSRLLALPNELLYSIIAFLKEEECNLRNLAATCRRLHTLISGSQEFWLKYLPPIHHDTYLSHNDLLLKLRRRRRFASIGKARIWWNQNDDNDYHSCIYRTCVDMKPRVFETRSHSYIAKIFSEWTPFCISQIVCTENAMCALDISGTRLYLYVNILPGLEMAPYEWRSHYASKGELFVRLASAFSASVIGALTNRRKIHVTHGYGDRMSRFDQIRACDDKDIYSGYVCIFALTKNECNIYEMRGTRLERAHYYKCPPHERVNGIFDFGSGNVLIVLQTHCVLYNRDDEKCHSIIFPPNSGLYYVKAAVFCKEVVVVLNGEGRLYRARLPMFHKWRPHAIMQFERCESMTERFDDLMIWRERYHVILESSDIVAVWDGRNTLESKQKAVIARASLCNLMLSLLFGIVVVIVLYRSIF